ncbi:MAG: septum formation initiator family protein [Lachnospiraceae bacterium]|nr:septum formation initiator family protein [Lachnospiraceae bacterium]
MLVLILIAMVVSVGVILLRSLRLQATLRENEQQIEELQEQIEAEKQRAEEIEEYGKYTQTNEYKEEVAKDKLGMVNDNEIIFRIENSGGGSQ